MPKDLEKISQQAEEKYNRMLDLSLRMTDDYNAARRLDVDQLRNLIVQISIVSFAAVGFSIPIIGSSSIVSNHFFFVLGLFFLAVSSLGGLWYAAIAAENSIIGSYKAYEANKAEADTAIKNQIFLMKNPAKYDEFVVKTEKFAQELKEKNKDGVNFKRDKVLYLLLTILSFGIICIFISILPISSGQQGFCKGRHTQISNCNFFFQRENWHR